MSYVIGIDFGGVLSRHDKQYVKSEKILEHTSTVIDMPHVVESLQLLHAEGHSLHIISFCGKKRAHESSQSLTDNNISHLFKSQNYVKHKQYKAHLCDYIGCNVMIDDRRDILDNIKTCLPHIHTIWLNTGNITIHNIHHVATNWHDVLRILHILSPTYSVPNKTIRISQFIHTLDPVR